MTRRLSVLQSLLREPARFGFDAALRVLMHNARTADPASAARFVADPALRFPTSEVAEVQAAPVTSGRRGSR